MSTKQAFRVIAENEIPPDVPWDYVVARPSLQALLSKAPERAKAAMVQAFRETEAAEVAAILSERKESGPGGGTLRTETVRALRAAGLSEAEISSLAASKDPRLVNTSPQELVATEQRMLAAAGLAPDYLKGV